MPDNTDIVAFQPEHTLDFYIERRNGKKRNYIFRYKKAQSCDHPRMDIIARGSNFYRCQECNYTFQWPGAIVYPQHFNVIMAAFQLMNFAKEYGNDSLQEVLRRPIGQTDGTPHKPVLPEGKSFIETMELLEQINTDQGDDTGELKALLDAFWVSPQSDKRYLKEHDSVESLQEGEHDNSNSGEMPDLPA
jgi:hypothetical protein